MPKANKRQPKLDPLTEDFGSYEAAADFWDTHDLTDYEDSEREVPEVQINLVRRHFRVEAEIARRLHAIARQRGVSSETLANPWLAEKLHLALETPKAA